MSNFDLIDDILTDLEKRVSTPRETREYEKLNSEQIKIKDVLEKRGIRYLIHFTDSKNIPSIKRNGLLSVEMLDKMKVEYTSNDKRRHDHALDYISLSVSGMNSSVYNSFRHSKQSIEHGVAVVIDAAMLYREIDTQRIYCVTNAATSNSRKGSDISDLEGMFASMVTYTTSHDGNKMQNRNELERLPYETTDAQAEILWKSRVTNDYILCYWDLEEDFFYGN